MGFGVQVSSRLMYRDIEKLPRQGACRTTKTYVNLGEHRDLVVYVYTADSAYSQLPPRTQAETLADPAFSTSSEDEAQHDDVSWNEMEEMSPDRELPSNSGSSQGTHHEGSTGGTPWHSPCGASVYCVDANDCCKGQKCLNNAFQHAINTVVMFGLGTLMTVGSAGFCGL